MATIICAFMLLLPVTAIANGASAAKSVTIQVSGDQFVRGDSPIRFEGVNDQVVLIFQLYPPTEENYTHLNFVFPTFADEQPHKIPASDMREFWYRYFWLVSSLGLNMVRLGGFDQWGLSWMHKSFYFDRPHWNEVVDPMFEMAAVNGVYIDLCMGGIAVNCSFSQDTGGYGPRDLIPSPMDGDLTTPGSQAYNEFVRFYHDVQAMYANETALAMIDLVNEPDSDVMYRSYWSLRENPQVAFQDWAARIVADCIAVGHSRPVTLGIGGGLLFHLSEEDVLMMQNTSADVSQIHTYGSQPDEHLVRDPHLWMEAQGRPEFIGEAGCAMTEPPWNVTYWPWMDQVATSLNISICWLELEGHPGYPIPAEVMSSLPSRPNEPVGLKAVAGDARVSLSWNRPIGLGPGPVTYAVYRDGEQIWTGNETTLIDTSVLNGRWYNYSVSATNLLGTGPNSLDVSAKPGPATPSDYAVVIAALGLGAVASIAAMAFYFRRRAARP